MILSQIRDYLQIHRRAALSDLAIHFATDPDVMRAMLERWVAKGRVGKLPLGSQCGGGCYKCDPVTIELYEWKGN